MILDQCVSLHRYMGLGPNFETAIRFLSGRALDSFVPGKLAIDGEKVYATVREADLTGRPERWETHRRYADIQILLEGREAILYAPPDEALQPSTPYNEDKDVAYYEAIQGIRCPLRQGDFMIFFPGEPHAPDRPDGPCGNSKKLVIKVKMEK
ncbi:MAG: YhcH/YjgK/YiaL family protein [Eubacteriales bacterium]|nr:YhcH/YjgK/YiaL family protein [Christensenellaceae bacterium]MEA5066262.1 YhcH/YjgK/YiaL family protein [Eubacteriales bacterium]